MATKITWNADADAKLFLGVLDQLRDAKLSLDYEKLAAFMGPGVVRGAIVNRITRLKRRAESEVGVSNEHSNGNGAGRDGDDEDNGDAASGASPKKKRKVQHKPCGGGVSKGKKVKAEPEDDGEEDE
ncbi:hypothetical protein BDV06DRAFT_226025 [Aspergillus oleicola]